MIFKYTIRTKTLLIALLYSIISFSQSLNQKFEEIDILIEGNTNLKKAETLLQISSIVIEPFFKGAIASFNFVT